MLRPHRALNDVSPYWTCCRAMRCSSWNGSPRSSRKWTVPGRRQPTISRLRGAWARSRPRDEIFLEPRCWRERLETFARVALNAPDAAARFPVAPPDAIDRDLKRLRRLVAA